jgi:hypothetical protein
MVEVKVTDVVPPGGTVVTEAVMVISGVTEILLAQVPKSPMKRLGGYKFVTATIGPVKSMVVAFSVPETMNLSPLASVLST